MRQPVELTGFTPPARRPLGSERRLVALAELLATLGLALGTVIAVTVVSVGIARADIVGNAQGHGTGVVAGVVIAALIGAMGCVTALSLADRRHDR